MLMILMIFRPQGLLPVARQRAAKTMPAAPAEAAAKEGAAP